MKMPKPSIGRIVHYALSAHDADCVNGRRADALKSGFAEQETGAQVHTGGMVDTGELVPAILTYVHSETMVNLKVFLDGNDDLWVTSRAKHDNPDDEADAPPAPGHWDWPPRV